MSLEVEKILKPTESQVEMHETVRKGTTEIAMEDFTMRRLPGNWRWSGIACVIAVLGGIMGLYWGALGINIANLVGTPTLWLSLVPALVWYGVILTLHLRLNGLNRVSGTTLGKGTLGYLGMIPIGIFTWLLYMFFLAMEAQIMASSIFQLTPSIPLVAWYAIISASFVGFCLYGMVFIEKFQKVTLPIFGGLFVLGMVLLFSGHGFEFNAIPNWYNWNVQPITGAGFLLAFGALIGMVSSANVFAGEITRFVHQRSINKASAAISFLFPVWAFIITIPFLGILLYTSSGAANPNPGALLVMAMGGFGVAFVILTQYRLNILNMYAATDGAENSFGAMGFIQARWKWVVVSAVIGFTAMCLNILQHIVPVVMFFGIFFWMFSGVILGDYYIVRRKLNLHSWAEFRRGYLPKINKVSNIAFWVSAAIWVPFFIWGNPFMSAFSQVGAFFTTLGLMVLVPYIYVRKYGVEKLWQCYFSRTPETLTGENVVECPICHKTFYYTDFVNCPYHKEWICSSCCAREKDCNTMCSRETTEQEV